MEWNGRTWYYKLVPNPNDSKCDRSLLGRNRPESLTYKLVVCHTPKFLWDKELTEPVRLFTVFRDCYEFFRYFDKTLDLDRSFYEVILGELPQKPHFDIDISQDLCASDETLEQVAEFVLEHLLKCICSVMADKEIVLDFSKDILIYSSNSATKHSYHVIIDNYCHGSNDEARVFFERVMEIYTVLSFGRYVSAIDCKVYGPRQQFRTLGSHKFDSNRIKTFDAEFKYKGVTYTNHLIEATKDLDENVRNMQFMMHSLISFTAECQYLPSWIQYKEKTHSFDEHHITESEMNDAIRLLHAKFGNSFSVGELKDGVVTLKRNHASYCPLCHRNHEHENPFMFIHEKTVYWNCRRNDRKYVLGSLTPSTAVEEKPLEPEPELKPVTPVLPSIEKFRAKAGICLRPPPSSYLDL